MTWYTAGALVLTTGSTAVSGTGTAFLTGGMLNPGDIMYLADGKLYQIAAIASDTSMTLASAYQGSSTSGAAYSGIQIASLPTLSAQIAALVTNSNALLSQYVTLGPLVSASSLSVSSIEASMPQVFESIDQQWSGNNCAALTDAAGRVIAQFPDPRVASLQNSSITSDIYETLLPGYSGKTVYVDSQSKVISMSVDPAVVDAAAALNSVALTSEVFETLMPGFSGKTVLIDAQEKVLSVSVDPMAVSAYADAAVSALGAQTLTSELFETLVSGYGGQTVLVDAQSKVIQNLSSSGGSGGVDAAYVSSVVNPITTRIDRGLTPYGDALGPYANGWSIRQTRMLLRKRSYGESCQYILLLFGDSYTAGNFYHEVVAKSLQATYGNAGAGWVGFAWWGTASGTWTAGSQPTGIDGSVMPSVVNTVQVIGTWTRSYNVSANNTPSLGLATSSTAGDYLRFTVPAGHTSAQLFYGGDGSGAIQVSWDDGATYGATINLSTAGAANLALSGIPSTATVARIKVVSGNAGIAGVDLRSTASGVRVHALGGSGAAATALSGVTPATWGAQIAALGGTSCHVMLGTNDQGAGVAPSTFAGSLATIFANLKSALPGADQMLTLPPENQRLTNSIGMPLYAEAAREFAISHDIAYTDLQYFFGSPANYAYAYAYANPNRPWYGADLTHPDVNTGGRVIADALLRLITQL